MSEWKVPDSVEEVVGYRVWDLTHSGRLRSVNSEFGYWTRGVNEASCYVTPRMVRKNGPDGLVYVPADDGHGPIPDPLCECGFWLLRDVESAMNRFAGYSGFVAFSPRNRREEPTRGKVIGEVRAWGRVVVGKEGWRVERAEISAFLTSSKSPFIKGSDLKKIADDFQVPTVAAEELDAEPQNMWHNQIVTFSTGANAVTWTGRLTDFAVADDPAEPLTTQEKKKRSKKNRDESLDRIRNRDRKRLP